MSSIGSSAVSGLLSKEVLYENNFVLIAYAKPFSSSTTIQIHPRTLLDRYKGNGVNYSNNVVQGRRISNNLCGINDALASTHVRVKFILKDSCLSLEKR
ncbi:16971_t:CDS:2 [Gigaspora rosea]|nr:16971_t:CDS:2 [Gigaspora rosea]